MPQSAVLGKRFPSCDHDWKIVGPISCTCDQKIDDSTEVHNIMVPPGTVLKVEVLSHGIPIAEIDSCPSCDHPHALYLFSVDALKGAGFNIRLGSINSLLSQIQVERFCLEDKILRLNVI